MWKAYDDNGVFQTGTREECIGATIAWLESDEAEEVA